MTRTYKLQHGINQQKQDKILAVLCAYRKTCSLIAKIQWRLFFQDNGFNKMTDLKNISSLLSERYKRNCCYQVEGALQSFISNRQKNFVQIVYGYKFNSETKKHLFQINRRRLWFKKEHELFTTEELLVARQIFRHLLSGHNKPSFRKANMLLNGNVAEIQMADKTKTIGFDYWIKLATLDKGKPVLLPIKTNKYFNGIKGELQKVVQINRKNNEFSFGFMKKIQPKEMIFKTDKISIDIGLKNLFAVQDGNLFGKNFYRQLKKYDTLISELASNRQRQALKIRSRRYDLLTNHFRNFLKNEIGRCLNRIIKLYGPRVIVIENLNFQGSDLSKRMNRILSNFGKKIIEQKLKSLNEEFGIEIHKINPAYTSQECPQCHYVDKKNRPTQERFCCKSCGYTRNADVVGARNHFARSSDKELGNVYLNRKKILHTLVTRFVKRHPRPHSWANGLLLGNPYFKDFLAQPKQVA